MEYICFTSKYKLNWYTSLLMHEFDAHNVLNPYPKITRFLPLFILFCSQSITKVIFHVFGAKFNGTKNGWHFADLIYCSWLFRIQIIRDIYRYTQSISIFASVTFQYPLLYIKTHKLNNKDAFKQFSCSTKLNQKQSIRLSNCDWSKTMVYISLKNNLIGYNVIVPLRLWASIANGCDFELFSMLKVTTISNVFR